MYVNLIKAKQLVFAGSIFSILAIVPVGCALTGASEIKPAASATAVGSVAPASVTLPRLEDLKDENNRMKLKIVELQKQVETTCGKKPAASIESKGGNRTPRTHRAKERKNLVVEDVVVANASVTAVAGFRNGIPYADVKVMGAGNGTAEAKSVLGLVSAPNVNVIPPTVTQPLSSNDRQGQGETKSAEVSQGKFWGWYNYESSPQNPMVCLADRPIRGKPSNCSKVLVFPRQGDETEDQWTTRAAASQGVKGNNKHIGKVM